MSNDAAGRALPPRLAAEGGLLAAAALSLLAGGYWAFTEAASMSDAVRWLAPTGVVTAWAGGYAWTNRHMLHGADGVRIGSLGLANWITLARAVLLAGVAGFAVVDADAGLAWVPA
ncbi:MAG: hypothetical protein ACOCSD_07950, partial [Halolamina sp.]